MTFRIPRIFVLFSLLIAAVTASGEVLTLDDCIRLALKNHPDVVAADNQVRVANKVVWQSFGAFLPSLSASASGSQTDMSNVNYFAQTARPVIQGDSIAFIPDSLLIGDDRFSKSYSIGLSAGITIFDGGQNLFNYLGSKADRSYFMYQAEQTRQNLVLAVKTTYFAYLAALQSKAVNEEAVKSGEEQYKLANSKFEVGSAAKSDVLIAQVQYGNDKLALLQAENTIQVARADLAYLIGVDVNSGVEFSSEFTPQEFNDTEESALSYGQQHQPGFLASKINLKSANYGLKSVRGQYLPTLTFSVGRSWGNQDWSEVSRFPNIDAQWSLRTTLSLNIFDGFFREASIARAKANVNNARASYYYAQNNLALQIKQSYLGINTSKQSQLLAKDNEASAQEAMAIVQEKYNLGAATALEMLDAQVSLTTAHNSRIQADFDYNLAVAKLENAMGKK